MTEESENPWNDLARQWQQLSEEQTRLGSSWLAAQEKMTQAVTAAAAQPGNDAFTQFWNAIAAPHPSDDGIASASSLPFDGFAAVSASLQGGNHVLDMIRRITRGPQLADAGMAERTMASLFELFVEAQAASRAYEAILAQAWTRVNQRFATTLAGRSDSSSQTPQTSLRAWLDEANTVFSELQRDPEFLQAQRKVMRAGIDYLLFEREAFEQLMKPTGLPTRTEIDELHRTVYTLKRQVRTLQRSGRLPSHQSHAAATTAGDASGDSTGDSQSQGAHT